MKGTLNITMNDPTRTHRREFWLRIVAPVAIPALALVILALVLLITVAAGGLIAQQITVAMSILASAFILLPLVLLCVIPYALVAVTAVGAGLAYSKAQLPLRFVRRLTGRVAVKTQGLAPRIAQPLIGVNTQLARLEYTARGWQKSDPE